MGDCSTYAYGECTYGVCQLAPWIGSYWGNATDWAGSAARAGFQVTMAPTVGAVVVYGAGDGYSQYGHVAYVEQVYGDGTFDVREMNYAGWNTWDTRRSNAYDVEGFILPPGTAPGAGGQGAGGPSGAGAQQLASAWNQLQVCWGIWIPWLVGRIQQAGYYPARMW